MRSILSAWSSEPSPTSRTAVVCGVLREVMTCLSCVVGSVGRRAGGQLPVGRPARRGDAARRGGPDGALEVGDLLALLRAPRLPGDEGRDQAEQAVAAEQQGGTGPAVAGV